MTKHLPTALFTARKYAKKYAGGGLASATEMGAKFYSAPAVAPFDERFRGDRGDPNVPEYDPTNIDKPVDRGSPAGLPDPTSKQYFRQKIKIASYQEGGEVEETRPPAPPPPEDPYDPLAASAGIAPASTPRIDQIPWGQPSWWEQAAEQSRKDQEAFAKEGVRGMLKDTEGTQDLAGGFSDAGILGTTKSVAPVAANVFRELAPEAVSTAKKIPLEPGHAPGSQDGAMHTGFEDGRDRYIKRAKSEDHALNERLGAAIYKELGVPSADVELTEINGKPHISSPKVPGVQLGASGYHPHELMDIQRGLPADQFLAGYDSIGLNRDNIIVDKNGNAHRIDFGGTMRYRAQGAPKTQWGPNVTEFQSFFDPKINPQAASSFVPYGKDAAIDTARKEMAGRIANLSNEKINTLVGRYGPKDFAGKAKLATELKSRRDQVAEFYGPKQRPGESFGKDPKADAATIMHNEKGDPTNVAEAMYNLAAKSSEYPEYVDSIYKHLPHDIQASVNEEITMLISKHGDPWKDEFHNIGHVEPAPDDWYNKPLTDEDWEKHLNESVPPLQANSQHLENEAHEFLESKGLDPTHPDDRKEFIDPVQSAISYGWEPPLVPKKPPTTAADIQKAKEYLEFLGHDPKSPDDKYLFADPVKWAETTGMNENTLFASLYKEWDKALKGHDVDKMEATHAALEAAKGAKSPAAIMENLEPVSMTKPIEHYISPPGNVPKPMQINKTHSPGQIVHALKDYGKATALQQPALITPKQIGKIEQIMASKQPEALATEMAGFTHDQISNLYSWMPQKHMDSVGDSLADLAAKGKAYHKGPDQYQKDLKEYYDNQDKHAQHEEALYTGEPTLPKPAPKAAPLPKKSYTDQEWMKTLFKDIPDWSKYKIKDSHQFVPLDIPKAHLAVLQQQHGFNPMKIFHSSGEFGPNKQVLYPDELWHPTKKEGSHVEQALFGSTHPHIAGGYHGKPVSFISRGSKTAEFNWGAISSYGGYNTSKMQAVIGAARAKGYDLVVVKGIHDIGDAGPQVQFLILEPEILRAPTANFDPTKLHKAWPLAGIAGGFMYTYGSMPGEKDQGRMAKGGKVMPLRAGSSKKVVSQNISEFHTGKTYAHTASKFGKERANKQAIAVALSTARKYGKGKALGGPNESMESMVTGQAMRSLRHEGMINSSVPGRTDKLPMKVRSGSYILPADIPSALGQGNTMAGGDILKKMFSSGPYGLPTMKAGQSRMQRPMAIKQQMMPKKLPGTYAEGGAAEDDHVPIVAAGGEYIIHPDVVRDVGHGDIKTGHKVLDKFVLSVRKKNIDTLKKLKPPKK